MSRASVVGACAAAAGGALAIGLLKRQFATATRKTAGEWLRDRVRVVPHSVLGTQLKTGGVKVVAPAPEAREVIVDPAGLPYVSGQRPPGAAGAASASIYKFLGLAAAPAFPDAVVAAIARAGDAKLHAYGGGGRRVRWDETVPYHAAPVRDEGAFVPVGTLHANYR